MNINRKCALSSWSGGKDSCLACFRAMNNGYKIKALLNFISREHKRCCFHGIDAELLKLQARAIGIPLVQKETTADMKEYEKEFKEAVAGIKINDPSIDSMVFGDIYLDEHRGWVERVCGDIGIKAVEPLWNRPAEILVEEFINTGFKTIIVSCQADKFNEDFIGRELDSGLLAELVSKKICPCGENGEFHTFVIDGPIFKERIEILESRPVLKEGFWKHYFLDIRKYKLTKKPDKQRK